MPLVLLLAMVLAQAAQQTPPAPPPASPLDHALDLIHQQKNEEAYTELLEIVREQPGNMKALAFLAAVELSTGRLDDCQGHVTELLQNDSRNVDLRELQAQLYMTKHDWDRAELEWRWVLGEHPKSEQAHMQLAAVLLQRDRYNDALAEVSQAIEINPRRGDERSLRGNILATLGRMDDAAQDWSTALVTDPDDSVALSGLAVYMRKRNPDQALVNAQRAVDVTGGHTLGPIRVLAMVYAARGEPAKQAEALQRGLRQFPGNPQLLADVAAMHAAPPIAAASTAAKPAPPPSSAAAQPAPKPPSTAVVSAPATSAPANGATGTAASAPTTSAPAKSSATVNSVPKPTAVASAPAKPPATGTSAPKPPPSMPLVTELALGMTLGVSVMDLSPLMRKPSPPSAEPAAPPPPVTVALAPRAPKKEPAKAKPVAPLVPRPAPEPPPADFHWGLVPLSAISPAFVYAPAPPPDNYPLSLGEAARRARDKKP